MNRWISILSLASAVFVTTNALATDEKPASSPAPPFVAQARLLDTSWTSESVNADIAAMAEELVAHVEGVSYTSEAQGIVMVDDLAKADVFHVRLVLSTLGRPWLREGKLGWNLEITDSDGRSTEVDPSEINSSTIDFPGDSPLDAQQVLEKSLEMLNRWVTPAYQLQRPDGILKVDDERLEVRFSVPHSPSRRPPSMINGHIGVRVPIRHAVFDLPENSKPESFTAGAFQLELMSAETVGMLLKVVYPNVDEKPIPEFFAIAADGTETEQLEGMEVYPAGEPDNEKACHFLVLASPMPPGIRVRIPAEYEEEKFTFNLKALQKDSPPRYHSKEPEKLVGMDETTARKTCRATLFRDGVGRATISVEFPNTPASAFSLVDFSGLQLDTVGSAPAHELPCASPNRLNIHQQLIVSRQLDEATLNLGKFFTSGGADPLPMEQKRTFRSAMGSLKAIVPSRFESQRLAKPGGTAFNREITIEGNKVTLKKPVRDAACDPTAQLSLNAYGESGRSLLLLSGEPSLLHGGTWVYAGTVSAVEVTRPAELLTLEYPLTVKAEDISAVPTRIAPK